MTVALLVRIVVSFAFGEVYGGAAAWSISERGERPGGFGVVHAGRSGGHVVGTWIEGDTSNAAFAYEEGWRQRVTGGETWRNRRGD